MSHAALTTTLEAIDHHARGTGALPSRLGYRGVVGGPELALTLGGGDRVEVILGEEGAPPTVLATSPSIARRGLRLLGELPATPTLGVLTAALERVLVRWPELVAGYPSAIRCERRLLGDRGGAAAYGAISARAGQPVGVWSADRGVLVLPAAAAIAAAGSARDDGTHDRWHVEDLADAAEVAVDACELASWLGEVAPCDLGCDPGCA